MKNTCLIISLHLKNKTYRDFPGGLVVRTWNFHCWGPDLIPGQGTKIPQDMQRGKIKTQNGKYVIKVMRKRICIGKTGK